MKILVVDDESIALMSIQRMLRRRGIRDVRICDSGTKAVELIKAEAFDVVLLDLLMPDTDGMQVLEATKPFKPDVEFVILTAVDDVASAVKAIRLGAFDYLVKPVENDRLMIAIERAYERRGLRAGLAGSYRGDRKLEITEAFSPIITQNPRMMELLNYARIMARGTNPILVTGDSGTGKELMARGIHRAGPVAAGPYVAVNVSAIPESLFESQIFGHIKGAFTGAVSEYKGFFEQADGGTLFLDEIGELPMGLQAKLLRVIEDQTVYRIGSTQPIPVSVRIVSATNINIDQALKEGRFRLDLMCRLKSVHIHLPPLNERSDDIPLLAHHFLKQACQRYGKSVKGFTQEALEILIHKNRPGNIRSLSQEVDNACLLTESEWIDPFHLGAHPEPVSLSIRTLCSLKENHFRHVVYVLQHVNGDSRTAAEILGVSIRHVQRILSQIRSDPVHRTLIGDI
jgi:DNA-binding NtrC family response regulator